MAKAAKIDDVGAYIPGARKNYKFERLGVEDLSLMSDAEIVTDVKKDHVWPKPDYATLVAAGMEPKAAAYLKVVRDRIASKPTPQSDLSALENSKDYVECLSHLRDQLEAAKTVGEVKTAISLVTRAYREPGQDYISPRSRLGKKLLSLVANTYPFTLMYDEERRALKLVKESFWVAKEDWQKAFKLKSDYYGVSISVIGGPKLKQRFASHDEAWAWLKEHGEELKKAANETKQKPKRSPRDRPHLKDIARTGRPDFLNGKDVSAEEFRAAFNFLGVQFGEWLPNVERQVVLNMAYNSLMDLAEVLGVEPQAISLGGTLSVAFGARGKGTAAATYNSTHHIFNLTRLSGAGCVAHEWAHGLDYYLARGTTQKVTQGLPAITGGHHAQSKARTIEVMSHHGDVVAEACGAIVNAMSERPQKALEKIAELRQEIESLEKQVARRRKMKEIWESQERLTTPDRKLLKATPLFLEIKTRQIAGALEQISALEKREPNEIVGMCKSEYLARAEQLDDKRSGEAYFTLPTELFARAFESYVYDGLAKEGAVSQYLVHSVAEADYDPEVYQGSPYIGGETRDYINGRMEAFISAIRVVLDPAPTPALGTSRG